jgi:hypothetical protein
MSHLFLPKLLWLSCLTIASAAADEAIAAMEARAATALYAAFREMSERRSAKRKVV